MNIESFKKIVNDLGCGPVPGKHAYVWHGDKSVLLDIVGDHLGKELDLTSDLAIEIQNAEDLNPEFGRVIEKIMEKKLFNLYSEVNRKRNQQMLIVSSSSILARYKIGLNAFYNYYLGDRTKVTFVTPKPHPLFSLPDYVRYDPEETLKHLVNLIMPENTVE